MVFKNDMTYMYAFHAALRRELERIARITALPDDDPKHILRATVLGPLPPPLQQAYRDEWQPAYANMALWASAR